MKKWWFVVAVLMLIAAITLPSSRIIIGVIALYGSLRIAEILMERD